MPVLSPKMLAELDLKPMIREKLLQAGAAAGFALSEKASGNQASLLELLEQQMAKLHLDSTERILAVALTLPGESIPPSIQKEVMSERLALLFSSTRRLNLAFASVVSPQAPAGLAAYADSLWGYWLGAAPSQRFILAISWALLARLPMAISKTDDILTWVQGPRRGLVQDPEDFLESSQANESMSSLLAMVVGRAAVAGDPDAKRLTFELMAYPKTSRKIRLMLLLGLGSGEINRGCDALIRLASTFLQDDSSWKNAILMTLKSLAVDFTEDSKLCELSVLMSMLSLSPDITESTKIFSALPKSMQKGITQEIKTQFSQQPRALRAIYAHQLEEKMESIGKKDSLSWDALYRERSEEVLLPLFRLLKEQKATLTAETRAALARSFAHHPSKALRVALREIVSGHSPLPYKKAQEGAKISNFSTTYLPQTALELIQKELWSGDLHALDEAFPKLSKNELKKALAALSRALEIPNFAIRRTAIALLSQYGGQEEMMAIFQASQRHQNIESLVSEALRKNQATSLAKALKTLYDRRLKWADDDAIDDYLAISGLEQVDVLRQVLKSKYYPLARRGAVRALARHQHKAAIPEIRELYLNDIDPEVREEAGFALEELGGRLPKPVETLGFSLLYSPIQELEEAKQAILNGDRGVLRGLQATLETGSWQRRVKACESLEGLPFKECEPLLVTALHDPDEDVRFTALQALVNRGWAAQTPEERTLEVLATRQSALPSDELDRETLYQALFWGGSYFRKEVLQLIKIYAPPLSEEEYLLIALGEGDAKRSEGEEHALHDFFKMLVHSWQARPQRARLVRELMALDEALIITENGRWQSHWRGEEAIAQALARDSSSTKQGLGPQFQNQDNEDKAIEVLAGLLQGDDKVQEAALSTLVWIGTDKAAEAIAKGLSSPFHEERQVMARALGRFGKKALPILKRLIDDPWWESRLGAAIALSQWTDSIQDACDLLFSLAVDSEYLVSSTALLALSSHARLPSAKGSVLALKHAQSETMAPLQNWIFESAQLSPEAPVQKALTALLDDSDPDSLAQRIGLLPLFHDQSHTSWLEAIARGKAPSPSAEKRGLHLHLGCRLAARDALQALLRKPCFVCHELGHVDCPNCDGKRETPCPSCDARGYLLLPCPNPSCDAQVGVSQLFRSKCKDCEGRGEIQSACHCQDGALSCELCEGKGQLGCAGCEGQGHF